MLPGFGHYLGKTYTPRVVGGNGQHWRSKAIAILEPEAIKALAVMATLHAPVVPRQASPYSGGRTREMARYNGRPEDSRSGGRKPRNTAVVSRTAEAAVFFKSPLKNSPAVACGCFCHARWRSYGTVGQQRSPRRYNPAPYPLH